MKNVIGLMLSALVFSAHLVLVPFKAQAAKTNSTSDFRVQVKSNYQVNLDGTTQVTHNFTITNLTPTKYIDKYALNITTDQLQNISAYEAQHYLKPYVVRDRKSTSIALNFSQPVVGMNQKHQFQIKYLNRNLASIIGNVLELNIPKIQGQDYDERKVTVSIPAQFKTLSYAQPKPDSIATTNNQIIIKFNNLKNQAITLIFGNQQIFNLTLRYGLKNQSQSAGIVQIALPPNTNSQQVYYQTINPEPLKITQDKEGNWLASYRLEPNETKIINAALNVLTTLKPNSLPVPYPNLNTYLTSTRYWPVNNSQIKELAQKLTTPDQTYRYVVETLNYTEDVKHHLRLGALKALSEPDNATCEEFSDLFITLLRAQKIPARRLVGYAYSTDPTQRPVSLAGQDILHAWADYLDPKTKLFKPVDPTWEKTTNGRDYFHDFDLNHIVFAINGLNDSLPLPAGLYITDETNKAKNINVSIGHSWPEIKPSFSLNLHKNKIGLPGIYQIKLKNETGTAWYPKEIKLNTNKPKAKLILLDKLNEPFLPFETKVVRVLVISQDALPHQVKFKLNLIFNQQQTPSYTLELTPTLTALPTFGLESSPKARLISVGIGVIIILIILTTTTIYLVKQKQKAR